MPFTEKKIREKTKLRECIQDLYDLLETMREEPESKRWLDARECMEKLVPKYSTVTVNRAKRLLGIRSERIRRHFRWRLPQHKPSVAIRALNDQKEFEMFHRDVASSTQRYEAKPGRKDLEHWLTTTVQEYMKKVNYDVPATQVYKELRSRGSGHRILFSVKKALGILSVRTKQGWRWVWAADEVRDLLEVKLAAGPVPVDKIRAEFSKRGWSALLLQEAKHRLGTVRYKTIDHRFYWYNTLAPAAIIAKKENTYQP